MELTYEQKQFLCQYIMDADTISLCILEENKGECIAEANLTDFLYHPVNKHLELYYNPGFEI